MSLNLPARRLIQTVRATSTYPYHGPSIHLRYLLPQTQRRHISWNPLTWGRKSKKDKDKEEDDLSSEIIKRKLGKQIAEEQSKRLEGETIFDDEIRQVEKQKKALRQLGGQESSELGGMEMTTVKEHMQRALDPDPAWRIRWQRKKVMQHVRKGGRLTKAEKIKMEEREQHYKSDNLPTSVKKLVMLSRQIAGKTVDEALEQMRFSKKKTAREIINHLKQARDRAVVRRGMGLGEHNGELLEKPKKIQTKDGKFLEITDPTRMYIDQSWVGKGPVRGFRVQYHARGRQSGMYSPSTHIAFILKEEKTRIRQHEERVKKQAEAKPWVHLPNRPITAQRQYYSW